MINGGTVIRMKTLAIGATVVALAITPTLALAGGQGVARSCGTIAIITQKPALGFPTAGDWYLNSFAPSKKQLIPCATVKSVAHRYVATGKHPGYVVKGFTGLVGRNLYKRATDAKVGFQIYRPTPNS